VPAIATPTFHHGDFDAAALADAKAASGQTISVCLPAHDEEATVGTIVGTLVHHLVERIPLVDEVVVVDDRSTDHTGKVAEQAGARVVTTQDLLPECGPGGGKGVEVAVRVQRRPRRVVRRRCPQLRTSLHCRPGRPAAHQTRRRVLEGVLRAAARR
jgi:hypothetical protein